ncbi:hypothetical protein CYLTODRAFT_419713 [Cylindrobasidium torrendii FP15055 ss-10]|uniref:Uncharacterized protein n=1 Tax=Cylindrobasidium torrendii FP15055 ss-10 TaxID=1314674 RepID=A0A0D7BIV0_9AGAR|nr:hypothetical protein CYLTODRAFT_419713 [Cylindrobasidium torrendii FP15055 ss-10]
MAFTVFVDADAAPTVTTSSTTTLTPITRSTTLTTPSVPGEMNKENCDPTNGERAVPGAGAGKKRKNSVSVPAATKALAPIPVGEVGRKKENDLGAEPESKKRKPLSSGATRKPKAAVKKEVKTRKTSTKRASSRAPSPAPLPQVAEEDDGDRREDPQATIDSKCYDLTVSPLADLSPAFKQSPRLEWLEEQDEVADDDDAKPQFFKDSSIDPEFSDVFSPESIGLESSRKPRPFTFASPVRPVRAAKFVRSTSIPRLDIPALSPSK